MKKENSFLCYKKIIVKFIVKPIYHENPINSIVAPFHFYIFL